ncbi:GNAT family N-acetyltransferase [Streptomyces sp. NPDC048639]|uniref:GNAT family N-acetyltransferase n=1 Tax=Streptomyces sp. NPDC048639 TaxID=3365581 RepID=UPI0037145BEB
MPTHSSLDVLPLSSGDRDAWDPLWQGYLDFYDHALPTRIIDLTWNRLCDPAEPMGGLGAWADGKLVGMCHYVLHRSTWAEGTYCYLEDLFTSPPARGRGVGRALIEATAEAGRKAGAEKLYWQTHAGNATARSLYDRLARHEGFLVYERPLV